MKRKYYMLLAAAVIVIAVISLYASYTFREVTFRDDHILIKDLSKKQKVLITLPRYGLICLRVRAKGSKQEFDFKKLELIISNTNNKIIFSTNKCRNKGKITDNVIFVPYFYSAPDATPPLGRTDMMTVFLKPESKIELEVKYQELDGQNIFKGASLEMVGLSKSKYGYAGEHFSTTPAEPTVIVSGLNN